MGAVGGRMGEGLGSTLVQLCVCRSKRVRAVKARAVVQLSNPARRGRSLWEGFPDRDWVDKLLASRRLPSFFSARGIRRKAQRGHTP